MTDLQLRNVFEKAAFQLKRNPTCQFHLVSPLTAQGLHDTCERIRRIKDNVDFFIYEELKIRSIKSDFDGFCRGFDLNPDVPDDQRKIFFYLQRLHFSHFQDDAHGHQNLLQRACYLITGDGDSIFATLREYAEQNLRRAMYANELRSYLAKLGLHPKNLSHDARIAPAIEVLQKEFLDSIAQNLIQRKMLGRPETDCLLKDIKNMPSSSSMEMRALVKVACCTKRRYASTTQRFHSCPYVLIGGDRDIPLLFGATCLGYQTLQPNVCLTSPVHAQVY
jgi:hypothetical protein